MKKKTLFTCRAAVIAALYVVLTYVSALMGLASGAIQVRLSEALCILPYFTFAAVPGITVGCFCANILFGASLYDIIFGTLASAIGALGAYLIRKNKWLVSLPTVMSNTIIIPIVLYFSGLTEDGIPFMMLTVGIGEVIAASVLGTFLLLSLEKYGKRLFYEK